MYTEPYGKSNLRTYRNIYLVSIHLQLIFKSFEQQMLGSVSCEVLVNLFI